MYIESNSFAQDYEVCPMSSRPLSLVGCQKPSLEHEVSFFIIASLVDPIIIACRQSFGQSFVHGSKFSSNITDNVFDTGHYFLEEPMSAPFRHKRGITLDRMEIDRDTGFAWCEFSRPINPDDPYDLDLSRSWHQFYFYGNMNQNSM